jgi:hypothetical protein
MMMMVVVVVVVMGLECKRGTVEERISGRERKGYWG